MFFFQTLHQLTVYISSSQIVSFPSEWKGHAIKTPLAPSGRFKGD